MPVKYPWPCEGLSVKLLSFRCEIKQTYKCDQFQADGGKVPVATETHYCSYRPSFHQT